MGYEFCQARLDNPMQVQRVKDNTDVNLLKGILLCETNRHGRNQLFIVSLPFRS